MIQEYGNSIVACKTATMQGHLAMDMIRWQ